MTQRPLLDFIYKAVDPILQKFGLGKSDFVALVVLLINLAITFKWVDAELGNWLIEHWSAWMGVAGGVWALAIRDAIRKAEVPPDAPVDPVKPG